MYRVTSVVSLGKEFSFHKGIFSFRMEMIATDAISKSENAGEGINSEPGPLRLLRNEWAV